MDDSIEHRRDYERTRVVYSNSILNNTDLSETQFSKAIAYRLECINELLDAKVET